MAHGLDNQNTIYTTIKSYKFLLVSWLADILWQGSEMKIEVLSLPNNSRDYARHEPISWPMESPW